MSWMEEIDIRKAKKKRMEWTSNECIQEAIDREIQTACNEIGCETRELEEQLNDLQSLIQDDEKIDLIEDNISLKISENYVEKGRKLIEQAREREEKELPLDERVCKRVLRKMNVQFPVDEQFVLDLGRSWKEEEQKMKEEIRSERIGKLIDLGKRYTLLSGTFLGQLSFYCGCCVPCIKIAKVFKLL